MGGVLAPRNTDLINALMPEFVHFAPDPTHSLIILQSPPGWSAVKIRGGGVTTEGFSHDPASQAAMYITHKITDPPGTLAGDALNVYMIWSGDLSLVPSSMEAFEVVNNPRDVTVSPPAGTHLIAIEAACGPGSPPFDMSGIQWDYVEAIFASVNAPDDHIGHIGSARSIHGVLPSVALKAGNAIDEAISVFASASLTVTPAVDPVRAYCLKAEYPTVGTQKWAAYFEGFTEVAHLTNSRLQFDPAAVGYFLVKARSNDDGSYVDLVLRMTDFVIEPNAVEAVRVKSDGKVGIGTAAPSALLDVNSDKVRVRQAKTPASAVAAGYQGEVCWDSGYVYVAIADNAWKRAALATW